MSLLGTEGQAGHQFPWVGAVTMSQVLCLSQGEGSCPDVTSGTPSSPGGLRGAAVCSRRGPSMCVVPTLQAGDLTQLFIEPNSGEAPASLTGSPKQKEAGLGPLLGKLSKAGREEHPLPTPQPSIATALILPF